MKDDWKKIVREAERQGWGVQPAGKGLKLIPPDKTKQLIYIHGTPSDHRAIKNKLAEMRRQGFQWPTQR